jgi:Fe2+ transport system protein B
MELSQVRQNIEDSKRLGSEKNIRNKSELDRRVRELKSNNTKKFVEERKRQTMKHEREKDNLTKSHETQKTTLLNDIDKVHTHIIVSLFIFIKEINIRNKHIRSFNHITGKTHPGLYRLSYYKI